MLLREHARRIVAALQVRHGRCFATERAKRVMVAEKRGGLLPGERSLYRVEKQLEARGELERKQIWPGDRMPNGDRASKHLVLVRLLTRQERRAKERAKTKQLEQRERAKNRPAPSSSQRATPEPSAAACRTANESAMQDTPPPGGAHSVLAAIARVAVGTLSEDPERFARERERQLAALTAFDEETSSPGDDKPDE